LFDINAARMVDDHQAHDEDKSVWTLCLRPDNKGFVSGSADHTVKFWSFDLVDDEEMNNTK
jgi:U3 small nucleolar RNA-associated protein 12